MRPHFFSPEQIAITSDSPEKVHAEYFEWESIKKAVAAFPGGRDFVIAELGAGFGRWAVNAVCMLRSARPEATYKVIAVEADSTHYQWLKQHLKDNGVDLGRCDLSRRPVTGKPEWVYFLGGDPSNWYGQAIVDKGYAKTHPGLLGWLRGSRAYRIVRSTTLERVLKGADVIDLLDMDIQGAEAGVFERGMPLINRKVLRIHISTHGPEIERQILRLLEGWNIEHYYPCLGERQTPIGAVNFVDGVIAAVRYSLP